MDLSTITAVSTYNYQGALQTGTQSSAVLQALTQAYASQTTPLPGATSTPDALAQLAGSGSLGALMGGIYSASVADGGNVSAIQGLNLSAGLDLASAATLLGESQSEFSSLNLSSAQALTAYQYQQSVSGASASSSSAAANYVQQLALTAQLSSLAAPLNLLA